MLLLLLVCIIIEEFLTSLSTPLGMFDKLLTPVLTRENFYLN